MARRRDPGPAGVLLVDKPAGMTSHDVVAAIRRERGAKAGHAGTLDPFATGLLVVLLGPATRLAPYLQGLDKTYRATARLGWRSSTGDPDGELERTGVVPSDLRLPTGALSQRLPMTSAARVDGERLYRRAHRGEAISTPEREVEVRRADLIETTEETATYEIECSSGTYVRTLVEELGDAYCEALRRTAVGDLSVADARGEPYDHAALEPAEALIHLPAIELDPEGALHVAHGREIEVAGRSAAGLVRLVESGRLVGVGEVAGDRVRPRTVLADGRRGSG